MGRMGRKKRRVLIGNTDYPPLPRPANVNTPISASTAAPGDEHTQNAQIDSDVLTIICKDGDLIMEYSELSPGVSRRWQVSSKAITNNSPYFRAMMDPEKFAEGRNLAAVREKLAQLSTSSKMSGPEEDSKKSDSLSPDLPTLKISDPIARLCGADAIEVFLKILCLETQGKSTRVAFENELREMPISTVEHALEIAEMCNSSEIVSETLKKVAYTIGRAGMPLWKLSIDVAKWGEDRVRQAVIIAIALEEVQVGQVLMHRLIVTGSKYWGNELEFPDGLFLQWQYLPRGLEDELYYRRQCVINTMTDLQAYFLRLYGAIEEIPDTRPLVSRTTLGTSFSTSQQSSPFQCRAGLANAKQCDLFQLGQMTRFFTMRSKTMFLGSTMLDPDFNPDEKEGEEDNSLQGDSIRRAASAAPSSGRYSNFPTETSSLSSPSSDLTHVIASLKQYPDYQIDPHHQTCGIRRRFLPTLGCIEKYVMDTRGLLGVDIERWGRASERKQMSWRTCTKSRKIDIHFDQIISAHFVTPTQRGQVFQEDEAKRLFTAKTRNWESR